MSDLIGKTVKGEFIRYQDSGKEFDIDDKIEVDEEIKSCRPMESFNGLVVNESFVIPYSDISNL